MALALSLCAALGLALVHLFAGKLRFLDVIPRSRWLSLASGISVAYVFVHLLPELHEAQEVVSRRWGPEVAFLDRHVYLLALAGLTAFYGVERAAERSRRERRAREGVDRPREWVFWLHVASFGAYNALIGNVLVERVEVGDALAFWVAMALHFVVNDYGLRQHHRDMYHRVGRWALAGSALAGWGVGMAARVPEAYRFVVLALIGGGVILNVLKEELPAERESRFWAFAVGAAAYAALLLIA